MDYAEHPLPDALTPWVKAIWTLQLDGAPGDWIEQQAMPDGCIEVILRSKGRSDWVGNQPARFAAGLATRTAGFKVSGDSRFLGIRLWPWTWFELCGQTCAGWTDRWIEELPAPWDGAVLDSPEQAMRWLADQLEARAVPNLARAIPAAATVGDLARRTAMNHRQIQRWFARTLGIAPSAYLKLMRFQDTLARITQDAGPLAHHAADAGYADQAHMARDMRALAGTRASVLRKKLVGPFVERPAD